MPLYAARCLAVPLALALSLCPRPARPWSPTTQLVVAEEAARLAPPDLYPLIDLHRQEFKSGVLAPFQDPDPARHVQNDDGTGTLDRVIESEVATAVEAIRSHRPFAEIVHQLGVVSHYMADADNPLAASAADPREADYLADYLAYVDQAQPRFPLLYYGQIPDLERRSSVAPVVTAALARSRALYPLIGQEYRRIGFGSGLALFDDRSTAFGVASVSFSHAVTDVAQVLRYIWLRAGGGDDRRGVPGPGDRLLLLPRHYLEP